MGVGGSRGRGFACGIVCASGLLLGACATQLQDGGKRASALDGCGVPYASAVQPLAAEGPPPTESSLTLVSLSPEPGAATPRGVRIEADLQFAIRDFAPGAYTAMLQFDTLEPGLTTLADTGVPTPLPVAAGTVKLCAPVAVLWRKDALRWPLRVHVVMTHVYPGGSSLVVAMTPTMLYGALERPFPKRDDDAIYTRKAVVHDAESRLDEYLELNAVHAQVCVERYPALAFRLEPARARWERATAEVRSAYRVLELRRDTRKLSTPEAARQGIALVRIDRVAQFRAQPDEAMRPWCEAFPTAIAARVTDALPGLRADLEVMRADKR